jgi:WD40 repeat protein
MQLPSLQQPRRRKGISFAPSLILLLTAAFITAPVDAAEPPITAATFTPDGKAIVVGSQAGIEVRAWPSLDVARRLETRLEHVHDLKFAPDGKTLAAGGGSPRESGEIEWFDWPSGALRTRRHADEDLVYAIAWSDDNRLASTSSAGLVRVFDADAKETAVLRGHSRGVLSAGWLPGGEQLVTAGIDQSLRLWNVPDATAIRTLDNHTDEVRCLAIRPGASGGPPVVASAGADRTVRLWQPTIGRLMRFARLPEEPLAIAWTPGGELLAAACLDGRLRLIDPDTVEIVHDAPALDGWAYTLAIHPDGKHVFVGGAAGKMKSLPISPR